MRGVRGGEPRCSGLVLRFGAGLAGRLVREFFRVGGLLGLRTPPLRRNESEGISREDPSSGLFAMPGNVPRRLTPAGNEELPDPQAWIRELAVGVTGFEPAASSSRTTRATKLRHTPPSPGQRSSRTTRASIPERSYPAEIALGRFDLGKSSHFWVLQRPVLVGVTGEPVTPTNVTRRRTSSASPRDDRRRGSGRRGWCPTRPRRAATPSRRHRAPSRPDGGVGRVPGRARGRSSW